MKIRTAFLLSAAALLALASCRDHLTGPNEQGQIGDAKNALWQLYQYEDSGGTIHAAPDPASEKFSFYLLSQPDSMWGFSGCNDFGGHYSLFDNQLSDTLTMSLVDCPLTSDFVVALENATILSADSTSLELRNDDHAHPSNMRLLWFHRVSYSTSPSDTIAFYPHPLIDGKDASGNGHDGQIPPPGHVPVSGRDRFGVDSLTSYGPITVSNTTDLKFTDTDSYTVSAWFELFGSGGENPVISLPTGCTIEATIYGSSLQIDLLHVNSLGLIEDSMAGAISLPHGDTGNCPAGWHLVTVAVTGNSPSPYGLAIYIDSQLVGVGSSSTLAPSPKAYFPLFVGYMGLLVDDAVILKGAKSASWVADRFHEGGWYEHHDTVTISPAMDTIWTPVNTGTSQNLVIAQFLNGTNGFVSGADGVFLATTDSGATWSPRGTAPVTGGGNVIYGLSMLNATTGFTAGDQFVVSKTMDGGESWQQMNTSAVPANQVIRSMVFTNANTGFVGTADAFAAHSGSICQSTDGGQNWYPIFSTSGGIYNIEFNPLSNNRNGVAIGYYGVAYWTSDGGSTWNPGSSDQSNSLISHSTFTSATTGFAVATSLGNNQLGYILETTDAGHTWQTIYTSNTEGVDGIASNGSGTITAVGFGGIVVESTDGGATWSVSHAGTNRWLDVRYASPHRAVLFGDNGDIDVRNK